MRILGKIEFLRNGGQTIAAILDDQFRWSCDDENILAMLNSKFPGSMISPAHGEPGFALLQDAAAYLNAKPIWLAPEPAPAPPGRIY